MISRPETRYAAALLDAALHQGIADKIDAQLREYGRTMKRNEDFQRFMASPMIDAEMKKDLIIKISDPPPEPLMRDFLFLLVDKNRMDLLPDISLQYWLQRTRESDVLVVHISSPFPLESEVVQDIGKRFQAKYNAPEVDVRVHKRPSLLGGIQVEVGNDIYDSSLRSRLVELRRDIGDHHRTMTGLADTYHRHADHVHQKKLIVHIGSAHPLSAADLGRVGAEYRDKYGAKQVETRNFIDPSLIAGLRIRVDADVYDGSVRGQLEKILNVPPMGHQVTIRQAASAAHPDLNTKTLIVHIGSAKPLSEEELGRVLAVYRDKYGAKRVEARTYVDPSLIGGLRLRVKDDIYDGSVQGQLKKILEKQHV